MVFRTPTPLKSIDLQYGQRVENNAATKRIRSLNIFLPLLLCSLP